jgi:lipopolysaccharide export system permease protein
MRILPRYVLLELIKIFLVSLIAITLMMIIVGVVKQAADQGLGPAQVVRLLPYILPDALRFSIPATALFSVCSVFGAMSGSNEVVAMKSLGISPMAVLWPVFVMFFVVSLVTVWLNDLAVSWGRNGIQRVAIEAVEEIAYGMLSTKRAYHSKQFSINVRSVEGRKLIRPTLIFQPSRNQDGFTITAEEAELRRDPEENLLMIVCRDFKVLGSQITVGNTDSFEIAIPLSAASNVQDDSSKPSQLPMNVIGSQIVKHRAIIKKKQQELAAEAAYQMMTGETGDLTSKEWELQHDNLKAMKNHLYRLKTEPHRRWSAGFSALCFVWLGAPVAIWRRSSSFWATFGVCFLPILAIYYPLLALGVGSAKEGNLPAIAVWMGNVVLLFLGALVLRRVVRY